MDVDTKASGVPAPGSDADVHETAAILLALRLGGQCTAKASAAPMPIQQQVPGRSPASPAVVGPFRGISTQL